QLLADAYFALPPPKSTGRDHFHLAWLAAKASEAGLVLDDLPPDDVQRTLVELTARSVAAQCPKDVRAIYVCGGGVHNPVLMQALSDALGCDLLKTDALGWPSQSIEAAAFAWLAQACVHRQPGNLPSVTGAAGPRILGSICPA
ncbi:MAG: anhydro-N-acetylmuramic acid kinase, partial [Burkholderiaceae bacterium]